MTKSLFDPILFRHAVTVHTEWLHLMDRLSFARKKAL